MFCLLCKQALGNLLAETLFQTAEVGLGWLPMQSWPKTAQATARQSRLFRACVTHLLSSAQNTLAPRKITRPVLGVRASFACPWPCVCPPTPKHVGTHIRPPGHTYTPPRTLAWAHMGTQAHIQAHPRYAPSLSHAELRVRPRRPTQLACTPRYAHGKLRAVPRTALGAQAYGRPARHVRQGHVQFCAGPHAIARKAHDIHTRCPTRSSAHRTTRVTDDARARWRPLGNSCATYAGIMRRKVTCEFRDGLVAVLGVCRPLRNALCVKAIRDSVGVVDVGAESRVA